MLKLPVKLSMLHDKASILSRFWKASSVRITQPSQQRSTDQKIMRCIDPGPSKKRSTAKRCSERPKALLIHASRTGLWAFWHVTRQVVIWHVLSCRATQYQGFFMWSISPLGKQTEGKWNLLGLQATFHISPLGPKIVMRKAPSPHNGSG